MQAIRTAPVDGVDAARRTCVCNHPGRHMNARGRFLALALIMITVCASVMVAMTVVQYRNAVSEHQGMLQVTARSQARFIEAIARADLKMADPIRDNDPAFDPYAESLSHLLDAHEHYDGFGETGELTVARRVGDSIVFLLRDRYQDLDRPPPVAFGSDLAEPMRRALNGLSGTVRGPDYRGQTVLAAHEPVAVLDLGIVVKIDIAEVRAPFIRSGLAAAAIALIFVLAGTALFFRIGSPILAKLAAHSRHLESTIEEHKRAEAELRASEKRLRALAARLETVREEERIAVSRELHDELGQTLTAQRMDLSVIQSKIGVGEEVGDLSADMARLVKTTDRNIDLVRDISARLRPPVLDVMGLGLAIEWHVDEQRARTDAAIHLDVSLNPMAVSPANATSIFRIAQESLTNVFRHSGAKNIWVRLAEDDLWVEVAVEDDGRGIPKEVLSSPSSIGLVGMQERATAMGGDFYLGLRPGGGTIVRVRIPSAIGTEAVAK